MRNGGTPTVGGSCKPTAIAANSAPPNGWRSCSFARVNSFSGTPSAFAEFQAMTRGTASQAIKALEAGGYLVRWRSRADRRSATLRLTDKGHEVVALAMRSKFWCVPWTC